MIRRRQILRSAIVAAGVGVAGCLQGGNGSSGVAATECPPADADPWIDETRCPGPSDDGVYVAASEQQVSLGDVVEFTLHNESGDSVATNRHSRGVYRYEDGTWTTYKVPSAIPAYLIGLDPGQGMSWRVSFDAATETSDGPHELTLPDADPGIYAFRVSIAGADNRSVGYVRRFEVVE